MKVLFWTTSLSTATKTAKKTSEPETEQLGINKENSIFNLTFAPFQPHSQETSLTTRERQRQRETQSEREREIETLLLGQAGCLQMFWNLLHTSHIPFEDQARGGKTLLRHHGCCSSFDGTKSQLVRTCSRGHIRASPVQVAECFCSGRSSILSSRPVKV